MNGQEDKFDLVSILIAQVSENEEDRRKGIGACVDRVRDEDYSVPDFITEVACLQDAVSEALGLADDGPEIGPFQVLSEVAKRLGALARTVVEETAGVYEKVVESGARGFCLFNADKTVIAANQAMLRLLQAHSVKGRPLKSFFDPPEWTRICEMLTSETSGRPRLTKSFLHRETGSFLPVGIETACVMRNGEVIGGYLCAVDLTLPDRMARAILDTFPLGVTKQTLKGGDFTYMNPAALRILGLESWEGKRLRDVFDDENFVKVSEQLQRRSEGLSDEYEAQVICPGDRKRVPVSIAAVPEVDLSGTAMGSMAIIRDLTVEKVSEKIHYHIASSGNAQKMLTTIARDVSGVIPFDRFVATQYSEDGAHLRDVFSCEGTTKIEWNIRWWPIPPALIERMKTEEVLRIDSFEAFLDRPDCRHLRTMPEFVQLLQEGFRSCLRYRVIQRGRLVAGISFLSKQEKAYGEDHEKLLRRLPLDKAMLMALHYEERRNLRFRLNLIQQIVSASENTHDMGKAIVEALADHYEWEHVSLFKIDEKKNELTLLCQKASGDSIPLPESYTLPLEKGVLGHVYRTKQQMNIPDVTDPGFRDIYVPGVQKILSELCLPIVTGGKVCWLLNIEDRRRNAFSKEETEALLGVAREIGNLLDRLWLHRFLQAILNSTSDLVFVANRQGKITHCNPEAASGFGYGQDDMIGIELATLFRDPEAARQAMDAPVYKNKQIILRRSSGTDFPVLLSASELSDDFEGKVFVCKDMTVFERVRELEALEGMFHELAVQTQTPLSLAFSWVQRVKEDAANTETAEILDKALKQLSKMEMTYNRLALYDKGEGFLPYREVLLTMPEVVDYVLSQFPKAERTRIDYQGGESPPGLKGDLFQLAFCLETILSFLLRHLPEDENIGITLFVDDGWVVTKISGFLPQPGGQEAADLAKKASAAKTITQMALGDEVIRRFIDNHGGRFSLQGGGANRAVFKIGLRSAQGEGSP